MAADHAVRDADILAEPGRRRLQRDAVIIGVGYHVCHNDIMTTVQVEGIVVVVVAVQHPDAVDAHAVTGQVVLHPASAVLQGNAADGDVLTPDET